MNFSRFRLAGLFAALFALSACSAPEPFVLRNYEFDRDNKYFPEGPKSEDFSKPGVKLSIPNAVVCYAGKDVDPAQVWALAREECGRFRRTPVFYENSLNECPLTTPRAAVFICQTDVAATKPKRPTTSPLDKDGHPRAPTTEDSPKFLFNGPGVNDRREQK